MKKLGILLSGRGSNFEAIARNVQAGKIPAEIAVVISNQQEAVGLVLQQLTNQQASISGVSLDEEATNLVMYQRAYEASARVISTIDELTSTTINMFTPS